MKTAMALIVIIPVIIVIVVVIGLWASGAFKRRPKTQEVTGLPVLSDGLQWRATRSQPLLPEEEDGFLNLAIVNAKGKTLASAYMDKWAMITPEGEEREVRRASKLVMDRMERRERGKLPQYGLEK